jgi:hypothetical protein
VTSEMHATALEMYRGVGDSSPINKSDMQGRERPKRPFTAVKRGSHNSSMASSAAVIPNPKMVRPSRNTNTNIIGVTQYQQLINSAVDMLSRVKKVSKQRPRTAALTEQNVNNAQVTSSEYTIRSKQNPSAGGQRTATHDDQSYLFSDKK